MWPNPSYQITYLNLVEIYLQYFISYHAGAGEEWRDGSVEKEVVGDELVLVLVGHVVQSVVFTLKFTIELWKGFAGKTLNLTALSASTPGRESLVWVWKVESVNLLNILFIFVDSFLYFEYILDLLDLKFSRIFKISQIKYSRLTRYRLPNFWKLGYWLFSI